MKLHAPMLLLSLMTTASLAAPRVLVLSVGLDAPSKASQEAFNQTAEEAVLRASRFELLPGTETFEGSASKIRAAKVTEAQNRFKDGKKFLDELDNQMAADSFVAALAAYRETDLSKTFNGLIDAWVLKAASHATGGELAPAKADIERVVAMRPATEFPNAFFPPELIKYAETQKKIAAAGKGELTVNTEPSGARVYVDGILKGISPVTVKSLPAGKHFVTAILTGWYLTQKEVSTGAETLTLLPSDNAALLKKAVDSIQRDAEGPGRDSVLKALGEKFQASQVLAVISRKSLAGEKLEVIVERLDVKDGHNLGFRQSTVPMGDADAVGLLVDAAVEKDAPREGGPVTHFQAGSAGSGRKVAGISLLGASAAFLAVGIASGVQAQVAADEFRRTPQVQTMISQNIATRGRTFSVVADVSYVLAAAAAGVGGYLTFSAPPSSAASDSDSGQANGRKSSVNSGSSSFAPPAKTDDSRARRDAENKDRKAREDEAARKKADADRQAEADKKAEADRKAEADKKAEADRKAADDERARREAEAQKQTPAQKKAEEARKKREEAEAKAKEEAEKRAEAERLKKEEAEKAKKEAADKKLAEENARKEAEAAKKAEQQRKIDDEKARKAGKVTPSDAEKKAKEEAEAKAREDEARKKAEEQKRAEDEARKKKEEEERKKREEDDLRNY